MKTSNSMHTRRNDNPEKPPVEFRRFFQHAGLNVDNPDLWKSYQNWRHARRHDDYPAFLEEYRHKREQALAEMNARVGTLPNAVKGKPYNAILDLPASALRYSLSGHEAMGLNVEMRGKRCVISGIPAQQGEYSLTLIWMYDGWRGGMPLLTRELKLLVNPDPAELWRNVPSDQNGEYARPDADFAQLACGQARMWAASQRGRSHAHSGLPRDDAFALACREGWLLMAVADGAGSAPLSRKGAELACETALQACAESLAGAQELAGLFENYGQEGQNPDWLKEVRKLAYNILPNAAFEANKAIRAEAEAKDRQAKDYASTLLLCLARRFPAGWALLSFQIGDGAMALLTANDARLLATPDEGEFSGQTRFVTMNEIFEANELMRRLRVQMVPDLLGLLLMTDGVSDALLPSMEDMNNPRKWHDLWLEIFPLCNTDNVKAELDQWLSFWSRGNHDDRTIAIMAAGC